MAASLFRWRGVLLGLLGLVVALGARPDRTSLTAALPLLLGGLALRGWAFRHLGSTGRTRDPAPPTSRVTSGPYAWFPHPVYLANALLAVGLLVSARLPLPLGAAAAVVLAALYLALAVRESAQIAAAPIRVSAGLTVRELARSERSTWLSVAVLLAAQLAAGASRL